MVQAGCTEEIAHPGRYLAILFEDAELLQISEARSLVLDHGTRLLFVFTKL